MMITASGIVTGQTIAIAVAAPITAQKCATNASPLHDERAARGVHASAVKKSLGLTRAATAMALIYSTDAHGPQRLSDPPLLAREPIANRPRMDMHVEVHGDGAKPHLLLVHGLLSSRAQWRPNLGALAAVSTPVVVELLGHGRSGAPAGSAAYTVAAYVRQFEALRERLGVRRWFICGQSFGAGLTIRYALTHPDRIVGQIFTNTMSGLSPAARERLPERAS